MESYILCIDQGTTSTKAFLLNEGGGMIPGAPVPIKQIYPVPGYVEHSPEEIYTSVLKAVANLLAEHPEAMGEIAAIGITNQRETTIAFGRHTLKSAYNAIVWQCRRTADICRREEIASASDKIFEKTGLKIDPYFSATKMRWIIENRPDIKEAVAAGDILFATVDGYLVYRLTDKRSFKTDYSNASRTMLFNINTLDYDDELLELFDIPRHCLAKACPSCSDFGAVELHKDELIDLGLTDIESDHLVRLNGVHIMACIGDQPSALFGQNALSKGDSKTTYGTGCFTLMNTGDKPVFSGDGLLTSAAWSYNGVTTYALEGSIFQGGSIISWLKDELKLIEHPADTDPICRSVEDNGGVYLVPAFTGLGAPYWNPDARGVFTGLTRGCSAAHIVRASVESIIYQVTDLIELMRKDTGVESNEMKVDGGVCASEFLMQLQADLLGIKIIRAKSDEMTAQGAGLLAGLSCGYFKDIDEVTALYAARTEYTPSMSEVQKIKLMDGYHRAVKAALAWEESK